METNARPAKKPRKPQQQQDINGDQRQRRQISKAERAQDDLAWQACVPLCGEVMRPEGTHGKSGRLYVIARTVSTRAEWQREKQSGKIGADGQKRA